MLKRPNKGRIFQENLPKYIKKILKYPKMLYVLHTFCQNRKKRYYFHQDCRKAKKRPNGQIILFQAKWFKKGQMRLIWPF
jgi:hypothetical protein